MGVKLSNNATSTLASSITNVATSLSVQSGDAALFPSLSTDEWFPITVIDSSGNIEVMRVTARTGAVLTVTRGQEGTTAQAFNAGSRVDLRLTAGGALSIPEAAVTDATAKTVPADADLIGFVDSAANFVMKKVTWQTLKNAVLTDAIANAASKATPVDADLFGLLDSAASNALKKMTWAALKETLEESFYPKSTTVSGPRNKIINPGGVYITRGSIAIPAASSAYVFDRFLVTNGTNQTVTVSQVQLGLNAAFAAGGERFVMRYAFSSAPTSGTLRIEQRIEDVTSIKAGDWTLTAWMSGPSGSETLTGEAVQHFGTGGSPSSDVTTAMTFAGDSPTTIYDASTNRRCWGVTIPSMSAKVLGTDNNDYLAAAMVLTPRQSGNYDITWVSFVQGDASNEYDPNGNYDKNSDFPRNQRFARLAGGGCGGAFVSANAFQLGIPATGMRAVPTPSLTTTSPVVYQISTATRTGSGSTISVNNNLAVNNVSITINGFSSATAATPGLLRDDVILLSAEL
ncbi:hypothetical protein [Labrenzia sp. R5_0]|uniref:hypothetical protein n=1 Tax=Labrenzia sp. R5_0 TaxID=2821108 RepID=UPI001AD9FEFE|nr:hypothetical protein [Labrenzia sp. R5_0]MBO9458979.1 hypothetical protein [Labrenzia sp. R5_0]